MRGIRAGWLTAVVAVAVLTACAPPQAPTPDPPVPTPSGVADECAAVLTELQQLAVDGGQVVEDLGTDPLGAVIRAGELVGQLQDLADSVSDPELAAHLTAIQTTVTEAVDEAQSTATSDPTAATAILEEALVEVQGHVEMLQAYCAEQ